METKGYYLEESETQKKSLSTKSRILSVTGGAYLFTSGLGTFFRPSVGSLLKLAGGAYLLFRGAKGYCPISDSLSVNGKVLNIRETLLINRTKEDVYALWRNLENLPRFMKHLSEINVLDQKRSLWKAKVPGGIGTIEWEAEILIDKAGEEISWRSVYDSIVDNSGKVTFKTADDGYSTVLQTTITYSPPAGNVGKAIAKLLNQTFENLVREDLKRFKEIAEGAQKTETNLPPKTFYSQV